MDKPNETAEDCSTVKDNHVMHLLILLAEYGPRLYIVITLNQLLHNSLLDFMDLRKLLIGAIIIAYDKQNEKLRERTKTWTKSFGQKLRRTKPQN